MPNTQVFHPLIDYVPAKLTEGKEWFISFYAINPLTNKLQRRRIKCNRIDSIVERRKQANKMITRINHNLANGWNPFVEQTAAKSFIKLVDVMDIYIRNKKIELGKNNFRSDSFRSYSSYINTFKKYLEVTKNTDILIFKFARQEAINFMNWVSNEKKLSDRTYNNYRGFFRTFFNWCKDNLYITENPLDGIKKRKRKQKTRVFIPLEFRQKIYDYLVDKNLEFLVVCQLVFHTLIRPKEISYLKISYIDLDKQTIFIPGSVAKNGNDRLATIPDVLLPLLKKLNIERYNKDLYLFSDNIKSAIISSENFKPGKERINPRRFSTAWERMRTELKLQKEMQLYSLRDSGIIEKLRDGISPEIVMQLADHSSLEITSIYIKHATKEGIEQIKKKCSAF